MLRFYALILFCAGGLISISGCTSGENGDSENEMIFRDADYTLLSNSALNIEPSGITYHSPVEWAAKDSTEFHIRQLINSQPGLNLLKTYASRNEDEQMVVGFYDIPADSVRNWFEVSAQSFRENNMQSTVVYDTFRHQDLRMANLLLLGEDSVFLMIMADRGEEGFSPASIIFILSKEAYQNHLMTIESVLSTLEPSW